MQKINKQAIKNKLDKSHTEMEQNIMDRIRSNEIKMKPKWFFVAGSVFLILGLVGISIGAAFLLNLTLFLIMKKGPGYGRLNMLLSSFPWWVPLFAIVGIVIGIIFLKKYDFSYKKNFTIIAGIFIFSIIITAIVLEISGLNDIWLHRGPVRQFFNQVEGQNNNHIQVPEHNRKILIK
jgi:hypothetical protein